MRLEGWSLSKVQEVFLKVIDVIVFVVVDDQACQGETWGLRMPHEDSVFSAFDLRKTC
jgi:hypothetical protein